MTDAAKGFITDGFPAPGLRKTQRLITGHGADGKGRFLVTDNGDHHRVMGEQQAVAVIPYSTKENPVELNENVDVAFARENEVCRQSELVLDWEIEPFLIPLALFFLVTKVKRRKAAICEFEFMLIFSMSKMAVVSKSSQIQEAR